MGQHTTEFLTPRAFCSHEDTTTKKIDMIHTPEVTAMKKELINLIDISKSFDGESVLDELNLSIHENEFLTLLGPSGCGKTTTRGAWSLTGRTLPPFHPINGSSIPCSRNMRSLPT